MNRTDLFLDKYKQLEEAVRSVYGLDDHDSVSYHLSNHSKFKKYKDDIRYCQDVRNLLSHKRKINGSYAVEPSEQMLAFLDRLIQRVRNRPRCRDIQVPYGNVFRQSPEDSVRHTLHIMRRKQYTQVPIMKNGCVIGVFNENSLFNYLTDSEENCISDELTLNDLSRFTELEGRELRQFIFFSENAYVDELEEEFEEAFRRGDRIGIAFLTSDGSSEKRLEGIITPWDIIALDD